jgi:hypothetical protein
MFGTASLAISLISQVFDADWTPTAVALNIAVPPTLFLPVVFASRIQRKRRILLAAMI